MLRVVDSLKEATVWGIVMDNALLYFVLLVLALTVIWVLPCAQQPAGDGSGKKPPAPVKSADADGDRERCLGMIHKGAVGGMLLVALLLLFWALIGIWPSPATLGAQRFLEATIEEKIAEKDLIEKKNTEVSDEAAEKTEAELALKAAEGRLSEAKTERSEAEADLENNIRVSRYQSQWVWVRAYSLDVRLMLVMLVAGALGSAVYSARAFAFHVGQGTYKTSWTWWYFLRLPMGMALALLMYLVLKAGLITGNVALDQTAADNVNIFGFAALAALTGMFSNQAYEKLKESYDHFFRTDEESDEDNPRPVIEKVSEVHVNAIGRDLIVTIDGQNFDESAAKVEVEGKDRQVKSRKVTELKFELKTEDVKEVATLSLVVVNPANSGGRSEEAQLEIVDDTDGESSESDEENSEKDTEAAKAAPPVISDVEGVSVGATGSRLKTLMTGSNFDEAAKVMVDGSERTAKWESTTKLQVTLKSADVREAKTLKIMVSNPEEKGGDSNVADLVVT